MTSVLILVGGSTIIVTGMLVYALSRSITNRKRCPACGNQQPDRLQSPGWTNSIEFLIPSQSYRCYSCGNRFVRLGRPVPETDEELDFHYPKW